MTRGRVATVVARTRPPPSGSQPPSRKAPRSNAELRTSTEAAALDRAAVTFAGRTLDAVAHASTTSGYVIGPLEEAALVARLSHSNSRSLPLPAARQPRPRSRPHGAGHVQLVHPPWFDDEVDQLGAAYFRSQGFDVVVTRAAGLPGDPAGVDPQLVIDRVEHHLDNQSEAIYFAGNGFRAAAAAEELELRTGRLVFAANQALPWAILEETGEGWDVPGYGRLLRADP